VLAKPLLKEPIVPQLGSTTTARSLFPAKRDIQGFRKIVCRSVEYKTYGWKLSDPRKQITFTDKQDIGKLKLKGTWDFNFYPLDEIKWVRLIRTADRYYVQFLISIRKQSRSTPHR
jgi:putative transposase